MDIEYLRSFRIVGFAIFDFVVSFLGIFILSPLLSKLFSFMHISIPKKNWIFLTLPIGVLFHLIFGSITPMTKDLLDINGNYFMKIGILSLVILGLRNIKIIKKSKSNNGE